MSPTAPLVQSWPRLIAVLSVLLGLAAAPAGAQPADPVTVRVVPQKDAVRPGEQFAIAVVMDHDEHFHSWPAAHVDLPASIAEFAIRTEIEAVEKPAWVERIDGIQWPEAKPAKVADPTGESESLIAPLYSHKAIAFIRVQVAANAPPGPAEITIRVDNQACDENICTSPQKRKLTASVRILAADSTEQAKLNEPDLFKTYDLTQWGKGSPTKRTITFQLFGKTITIDPSGGGFALLLLLAALGGLLLNFTPCVLPVIPIKIIGLSNAAGNPRRCLFLGIVMSIGVVAFWLVIGGLMASLASFKTISHLFQYPAFGIAVGVFMLFMALGMLGTFSVGLPNWVYMINPKHESVHGSFLFGILTAVLSTPCTAPFMGAAAAWAVTQSPVTSMATFAAIGAGMALPYLILSASPGLVKRMPRTGPASELIKQVMGLLMLAVAVFFMGPPIAGWLQAPPNPPSRLYWWIVGLLGVFAGGLLVYKTLKITSKPGKRAIFGGLGLVVMAASGAVATLLSSHGPINWVYYTPQRFQDAVKAGNVVVVDFTAEWCLNCKTLESGVLHRKDIVKILNDGSRVTPIKVDFTGDNPEGTAKLKELDWVGIPLLAIYGPGLKDPLKFDSYTPQQVLDAIERARGTGSAAAVLPAASR